jgi:quinolinate synthase
MAIPQHHIIPVSIRDACDVQVSDDLMTLFRQARSMGYEWQPIPERYHGLPMEEITRRIHDLKAKLGNRIVILGHHYQREDIIQFADYRGDSFKLAQYAASRPEAEYIIFCGVHFMAESADILSAPHQKVVLPNLAAGCHMADMADPNDVFDAWEQLRETLGDTIIPITYMNSTASLKAFCGAHGGAVCTSSNAKAVLTWALQQRRRVLFFPDEHLGRNVAYTMGFNESDLAVWAWREEAPLGGLTLEQLERATFILWKGYCPTHDRFKVEQVLEARAKYPGIKILVHPEVRHEVAELADLMGSTEFIAKTIAEAPPGSIWGVATEINLVSRLARENPDKVVFCLDPIVCPCSTMYRIHPAYLLWALEAIDEGNPVNIVKVDPEIAHWAKVALDRMLAIT